MVSSFPSRTMFSSQLPFENRQIVGLSYRCFFTRLINGTAPREKDFLSKVQIQGIVVDDGYDEFEAKDQNWSNSFISEMKGLRTVFILDIDKNDATEIESYRRKVENMWAKLKDDSLDWKLSILRL